MMEFHRGREAIAAGHRATLAMKETILQAASMTKSVQA